MAENQHYQNDEIDLREMLAVITSRKKFIIGFTSIATGLAILYALSITPTYKASISFLSPNLSSVIELNKILLDKRNNDTREAIETIEYREVKAVRETREDREVRKNSGTRETIYQKFLNKFMSKIFQRKVFDENDYLAKLNPKNKPIDNLDDFFYEFSKSLNLQTIKTQKNVEKINFEKPIEVTIEGSNAQIIANYLNDLASSADQETVNDLLRVLDQKIVIRLEEISNEIELLRKYHNIKIKDQIEELSYNLTMAKELKIKNHNLGSTPIMDNSSLIIDSSQKLPTWYLFGEDALAKEVELLKSKKYSHVPEISKLIIEKIRLESLIVSNTGRVVKINSMQINQHAFTPRFPIKPNRRLIVSITAVACFMLSILLVFIMNALRPREAS